MRLSVAPLFGPIRLADLNWFQDARLILFIYFLIICFFFQKCRNLNPWPDSNGGSKPEPGLLRPFSFILSKTFYLCHFFLEFQIRGSCFKW